MSIWKQETEVGIKAKLICFFFLKASPEDTDMLFCWDGS